MARDGLTGRTLGDFVVRDKLGEGGFGAVYRAEQPLLEREAVIKVLHRHLRASDIVIQRFLREARLASQLDHPYAAHIYAFGAEPDGLLWIAMELVRGTPLDAMLRASGPMPAERLVQVVDRICEVVHTAHEQGIVHRDIKPANVIVMSRAGRVLPKLLDFGIAKASAAEVTVEPPRRASHPVVATTDLALDSTAAADVSPTEATLAATPSRPSDRAIDVSTLTREGALVGSPHYMAPEQWLDPSKADARADIYALGVLAYEALTGRRPFDGKTLLDVAEQHAAKPVPPVGGDHPVALDAVFARALAKAPADRYASALELAVSFRGACGLALDTAEQLPQIDETLRDALIADAPQPIAEAIAALAAARNVRQARDAASVVVRVVTRCIGIVALASRTRLGPPNGRDSEAVVQALLALRRRMFSDEEWLDLARELCRAYADSAASFPIPELVTLFFDATGQRPPILDELLALVGSERASGASDDQVREQLQRMLPGLERLLRAIAFLSDYPLVVWHGGRAEQWMGLRRSKRAAIATRGTALVEDQPALVDREGRPVLALWPLVQVGPPSPGAADELFLFEGKGRHGGRLVALPQELERHDDTLWSWFGESLLDSVDSSGRSHAASDMPYRGLAPFGPGDASLFFGREREIDAFVNRLRTQPLIAVVGPSGAGKSSFVQAGAIPALPEGWHALTLRPGPAPLVALESRLADLPRVRAETNATTIVLVVDQLEELFTLCHDAAIRLQFVETLVGVARSIEEPMRVVLTLRDDFLIAAEQLAPLRTRLAQGLQLLATPARDDLVRILVEPARAVGYDFEDRTLPERMVDEVVGQAGALALLSFSAAKLWELRDRHFKQLSRKAYDSMGGVGGALAKHADAMLDALSVDEQRLVREAFRNLVTAEGTRAVLGRHELLEVLGSGPRAAAVVERLVAARLLVASEGEAGEERIEIIHEAMLEAWPRLVAWRREDAEGARLRDQLRVAAKQWQEHGRTRGLLWRDEALAEYQLWRSRHPGALTELETAFGNASVAEAARGRRVRRGILAAAFVALVGVAIALTIFNREARHQADAARRQIVKLYVEQSRRALLDGDRRRSLVYAAEAWERGGRDRAIEFLLKRAGTALDQEIAKLEHRSWVRDAQFSPDGKTVVTISDDFTAKLWDASTGRALHVLAGHTDWVRGVVFAPDGKSVVTTSWDGTARAWDVATGQVRWTIDLHGDTQPATNPHDEIGHISLACAAAASTDGRFVVGCVDRRVAVVSPTGVVERWLDASTGFAIAADVSSTGRVVVVPEQGSARIFELATGALVGELAGHTGPINSASFSRDGSRVVTASSDGTARIWSADGTELAVLRGHQGSVRFARLTDDNRVVTASVDRTVRIWDGKGGHVIAVRPHDAHVEMVDVSPSGDSIVSGDGTGVWTLSDRAGNRLATYHGHELTLWKVRFAPDGRSLVTASGDGTARLWRVDGDTRLGLPRREGAITGARFAGTSLLVSSEDGRLLQWKSDRAAPVELVRYDQPIWALQVSRDERLVALATGDGTTRVLELVGAKPRFELAHPQRVNAIAFSPTLIATASDDGVARLWDQTTGALVGQIAASKQPLFSVAFDGDGTVVATGGDDGVLRIWDVASKREQRATTYRSPVNMIAFCDRRVIAATGTSIHVSSGDGTSTGIITAKGELVISAGGGEVLFSDLVTGLPLERVDVDDVNSFAVDAAADGRVVVGGLAGVASIISLATASRAAAELAKDARARLPLEVSEDGTIRVRK